MHRAKSFHEAEAFDNEYYARMTPEERLEIVQFLREMRHKSLRKRKGAKRTKLQKVVTIIKQVQT